MNESTITAAAIVRFSQELEANLAAFYNACADRFPDQQERFAALARGCEKASTQVTRTYQETVTDALETGFSFAGLSLDPYQMESVLPQDAALEAAVGRALAYEAQAAAFYEDVTARSAALLATIPRAFKRAARIHRQHSAALAEA